MGSFLTRDELAQLAGAECTSFPTPIPTRMISNGEFTPLPQTSEQARVEALMADLGDRFGRRLGQSRREFLRTAGGMAAAFLAMNQVYGSIFRVNPLEAAQPAVAEERAKTLAGQFIFDAQVHFVRDASPPGSNPANMLGLRNFAGGFLNEALRDRKHDVEDIKFQNFVKEVFFDSDTRMAILSGAPSDELEDWFLTNDQMHEARRVVNEASGSRRLLAHAVFTPGQPGWIEEVERAITLRPDSWKGYTVGDPNGPSKYRWRLDDEKLLYPVYEKMVKSGIRNICIHKGLLPGKAETKMPGVTAFAGVDDVGKAAKDWPQLNFIIYHAAYNVLMPQEEQQKALEETGYVEWASDLAAIPETFKVENVYAEIGSSFGISAIMQPRFCAGMMGALIKGMGVDKIFWGTDSVWYGSPQWQIEAFRRIEIPEDLQKKFGFTPLGDADGPLKRKILGENGARLYGIDIAKTVATLDQDKLATARAAYTKAGGERSNLAYGFVNTRI